MKNKIAIIVLSGIAIFGAGCASTPHVYQVKLDSDPEGARVFLNMTSSAKAAEKINAGVEEATGRDYLGVTPCTVTINGTRDGFFLTPTIRHMSKYVGGVATFTAEPPSGATNLFRQMAVFRGNTPYVEGDKIPQGVFFDLHKNNP